MDLEAQLQVQGAVVGSDARLENGDPADASGFRVKRARLGVSGTFTPTFHYSLIFSFVDQERFGGRDVDQAALEDLDSFLYEALLGWQPMDEFGLWVGTSKMPFSAAQMDSSKDLLFIERPRCVEEIAPDRRLGISVQGSFLDSLIGYSAGVFNSTPGYFRGEGIGGISLDGTSDDRPFAGIVAGRLEFAPLGAVTPGESDFQRERPLLKIGVDAFWDSAPATEELSASADIAFKWMGISLLGEYLWSSREPRHTPTVKADYPLDIERNGWYVQFGYMLDPSWVLGVPIELAFRFEQYDDNHSALFKDHGDQRIYTGGMNAYFLSGTLKLQVNYLHRQELFGPEVQDDAFLGLLQWRI